MLRSRVLHHYIYIKEFKAVFSSRENANLEIAKECKQCIKTAHSKNVATVDFREQSRVTTKCKHHCIKRVFLLKVVKNIWLFACTSGVIQILRICLSIMNANIVLSVACTCRFKISCFDIDFDGNMCGHSMVEHEVT